MGVLVPYPTPPNTPPAALIAAAISPPESVVRGNAAVIDSPESVVRENAAVIDSPESDVHGKNAAAISSSESAVRENAADQSKMGCDSFKGFEAFAPWKASFIAATRHKDVGVVNGKTIDKFKIQRILRSGKGLRGLHRKELPDLPKSHGELKNHLLGAQFKEAEEAHLKSHIPTNSWSQIEKIETKGAQILDCMWVYVYKFDKHGRLIKCKARLVVRGDQQKRIGSQNTYAATLAARSFRTLMAIAARFDLELKQYDAVNAFVNAPLEEEIFMRMPPGYRVRNHVLKLNKALYGLRSSPLLWQKMLTNTLKELGFKTIPHEPCCMIKGGILIFFYVDDIVLAYRKEQEAGAQEIMEKIKSRYEITGGEDLQWFLGIRILREREKKLIWLSQASYVDKIIKLADSRQPDDTPMSKEELLPFEEEATIASTHHYQRKVGSLMYAAVSTRIDICFAVSRLSRFLLNPGPQHHAAADRVICYLEKHRDYALRLGGGDDFGVASDASFADNSLDRKSSQAYTMSLFGGIIGWQANKQDTVTTSTTEAELLALSQAAKEGQYIMRLLKELSVTLDDHKIYIECDNQQTIRLVTTEIARLQTKLRHVDIHNHWLRQEVQKGRIDVRYTPTKEMIANGLTKALSKSEFKVFLEQVGIFEITEILKERVEPLNEVKLDDINDEFCE
jgi:hypothetical protein